MESMIRNSMGPSVDATSHGIDIIIERHAWAKMHGWCRAANSEVSGLGLATLENGKFTVTDVYLPKQKCSGSYTELDDGAVGRLLYRLHKKGKDVSKLKFWWHTHYNFSVFWSGTDDDNAQRLAKANGEWELSVVINQKGEYRARVDFIKPIDITLDNLKIKLCNNSTKRKRKRNYKSDIKKWVRPLYEPVVIPSISHSNMPTRIYDYKDSYDYGYHHGWYDAPRKDSEPMGYKGKKWWEKFNDKGSENKKKEKCDICGDNGTCLWCRPEPRTSKIPAGYEEKNGILVQKKPLECKCPHTGGWEDCQCNTYCDLCVERLVMGAH